MRDDFGVTAGNGTQAAIPAAAIPQLSALAPGAHRLLRMLALAVALGAHIGILFALVREPDDPMAGGAGQKLDAINVTLVSSAVLESREQDQTRPPASALANSVEADDGALERAPVADQREEKKEENTEKEQPVREAEAIIEVPKPAERQEASQAGATAAGGAAARGDASTDTKVSAPAAASPGAVREYARYVSQALGKTKPKGTGGYGTARIKFTISADGSLSLAEVMKSSGSKRLDATALEAVRRAKFAAPPAGMTALQLTYEVPYNFR